MRGPLYRQVLERDGRVCQYCGATKASSYTVDHIFPRSLGGIDALCNLVIACRSCNSSKGALVWTPHNFDAISAEYPEWRAKVLARAVPYSAPVPRGTMTVCLNIRLMNRLAALCSRTGQRKTHEIDAALTAWLDGQEGT